MEAERERELVERELLRAQCLSLAQEKVEAEKSSCCAMPLSLFWICFESVPIFFVCFFFLLTDCRCSSCVPFAVRTVAAF
jgi:hypothetical protein